MLNQVKTKKMCSQAAKSFDTQTYRHIRQVPAFPYSVWIHHVYTVSSDTAYTLILG